MDKNVVWVRQCSASEMLQKWTALVASLFESNPISVNYSLRVQALDGAINNVQANQLGAHSDFKKLLGMTQRFSAIELRFLTARGRTNAGQAATALAIDDAGIARMFVEDQVANADYVLVWLEAVDKHFGIINRPQLVSETLSKAQVDGLKWQEHAVATLSNEVSRLGNHLAEEKSRLGRFIEEHIAGVEKRRAELDAADAKRRADFEAERARHVEELAAMRKALEDEHRAKTTAVEERERELRLQTNTTERRKGMDALKQWLDQKKAFKLSPDTERKRLPVTAACVVGGLLGIALAVVFGRMFLLTTEWRYAPFMSSGLLIAASTFIYYLKWADQWFKEHARAEFRNRRLEADIQRAAWLSEMFFETKDKQLPESFFEHFARGLFVEEQTNDVEHPADQLAKLAKSLGNLKVGAGAVEIGMKQEK